MFMWLQPSPCLDTTNLFSGAGDKDILIDVGAHGEVRSKTGEIRLCQQHDDGFACVRSCGTSARTFLGSPELFCDPLGSQNAQNGEITA
jgi:hypothetical protein